MPHHTRSTIGHSVSRFGPTRQGKRTFLSVAERVTQREDAACADVTRLSEGDSILNQTNTVFKRERGVLGGGLSGDLRETLLTIKHANCDIGVNLSW